MAKDADELVAWLVAGSLPEAEIRSGLRRHLPEWSVPDRFVTVDTIPLTRNGKPDVAALLAEPRRQTLPAGRTTVTRPRAPTTWSSSC